MAQLKDLIVTGAGRVIGKLYASAFVGNGAELTNLNASNVSSGTLAVGRGGTGATNAAAARTNLGAAAADIVVTSSTQPTSDTNYIWINA